jgi:hypothetical protein
VQGPAGVKSYEQVSRPDRQLEAYEFAVLSLADAAHCICNRSCHGQNMKPAEN